MSDDAPQSGAPKPAAAKVVIAREEKCLKPPRGLDARLIRRMLDSAVTRLTGKDSAKAAWAGLFAAKDRVAIKVNTLGHHTHPVVAATIAECLLDCGVPGENILIWDRSTAELRKAGFAVVTEGEKPRCFGTDSIRAKGTRFGYEAEVATSGAIGSRFSAIVSRFATALISAPVLKDHSLAGLSGGLKHFFGAIPGGRRRRIAGPAGKAPPVQGPEGPGRRRPAGEPRGDGRREGAGRGRPEKHSNSGGLTCPTTSRQTTASPGGSSSFERPPPGRRARPDCG